LKEFSINNCFETPEGILTKLKLRYKDSLLKQLFLIIGSIDLIGNPIGLINNIGSGLSDLIKKPAQGFV
jgi:vacuolar protein sorting-associated protein 13A/C